MKLTSYLVPFQSYRSLLFKFSTLWVFEPPFGELRDNMRCPSWLTGKRVDFLLVLTRLFSLGHTAKALRAKIDRKSAISLQRGHFNPTFQVECVTPRQSFSHGQLGQWMPYNFVADSFHTKKAFFEWSTILDGNRPFCVFEPAYLFYLFNLSVHSLKQ